MKAPFPWPGGKFKASKLVWDAFGDVGNYIEPFAGSLAVLLERPHEPRIETVNDANGYICNFWRAIQHHPDEVATWADWPVNELDLHARHAWLLEHGRQLASKLLENPEYCDRKVAGWWVWGICQWIGGGWCDRQSRKRPRLSGFSPGGIGVHAQNPMGGIGSHSTLLNRFELANRKGIHAKRVGDLSTYFEALALRLRRVRVLCGDWTRVLTKSVWTNCGNDTVTGILLDPPYAHEERYTQVYGQHDDGAVAARVREWALAHGDHPTLRIALCGLEGEHKMPDSWSCSAWKAHGGYGNRNPENKNRERERIWFSPHCLKQRELFSA